MSTADLLTRLGTLGVSVTADGDRLHVDGPDVALTDELLAELRRHKPALLEMLAAAPADASESGPAPPTVGGDFGETGDQPCPSCHQTAWRERSAARGGRSVGTRVRRRRNPGPSRSRRLSGLSGA